MKLFIILYLVGFLRTLIIIAIIYYGIKLFSKYVLPMLIVKGVKNMQQKMQNQQGQNQKPSRPDGEVTIEKNKNDNQNARNRGEYVDFEEIE